MARRRRRRNTGLIKLAWWAVLAIVAVGLIQATHGLIVLALLLGVTGWFGLRLYRKNQARAVRAAHQQHQLSLGADLGRLFTVSPTEFEQIVGQVLQGLGYSQVEHVGRTRDRGIDLWCTDPDGRRTAVQCKQYAVGNKVGGPAVRNLIGAAGQGRSHHAMLVATSSFTAEAVIAAQSTSMTLIDGPTFVAWARQARARSAG